MGRRIRWLGLVLVVCFALVLLQLVNIQLRQATHLGATKNNPRNLAKRYDNARGTILAANGTVLAQTVRVKNRQPGQREYYRHYPGGTLYSGIVGYSSTFYGTAGVEYVYNTDLSVHEQKATDFHQLLTPPGPTTNDVTTTVIPALQQTAKQALASIPDTNKDGAVVALDPKTGAVLAMYSSPSFDPTQLATPTLKVEEGAGNADFHVKDPEGFYPGYPIATFYPFLPGSTFKVVTSTAVYNLKPTLENFNFPVAGCTTQGAIPDTTKQICNDANTPTAADPCGGTMVQMLPESCDPGYAMLGLALGGQTLYKQATLFGMNKTPPIDLYPVSKSNFPTPADFAQTGKPGPPGVAYSAFGQQTVTETALQNAMVAEGIADTGTVMTPHVMAQIDNSDGGVVERYKPTAYEQAATPAAAKAVSQLMQSVVTTPSGTAAGVGFPSGDEVAVKTGTAQTGTKAQTTIDWMIGFAPASNPVVAIAVVVPSQSVSASGAEIAGPIMKTMIDASLADISHGPIPPLPTTTTTTAPTTTTTTTVPTTVPATTAPSTSPLPTLSPLPRNTTTTTTAPTQPATTTTTTAAATTADVKPSRRVKRLRAHRSTATASKASRPLVGALASSRAARVGRPRL